jgi:aromatic-L-amino-acid decarboxylase
MAPSPFSVVCFRVHPPDMDDEAGLEKLNSGILHSANATGKVFLSHTKLNGRYCLRIAVGNLQTRREHLERAFELICSAAGVS